MALRNQTRAMFFPTFAYYRLELIDILGLEFLPVGLQVLEYRILTVSRFVKFDITESRVI